MEICFMYALYPDILRNNKITVYYCIWNSVKWIWNCRKMTLRSPRRHECRMSKKHPAVDCYRADYWEMAHSHNWPLYPYCVEETIRHVPTWFRESNSKFMMLVLLLDGQVTYECPPVHIQLIPGKLLILPIGADYSFESESTGGYYHKIVVELKGSLLSSLASALGLDKVTLVDCPEAAIVAKECRNISETLARQRADDIPILMGRTYDLLHRISLLTPSLHSHYSLWSRALAKIESHLDDAIPIAQLATESGISCSTLNRMFRENVGESPQKYRTRKRMQNACELLKNSSLSIKEIARRVGYCNQFYFTNEFKRMCGVAPRVFRHSTEASADAL